MKVTVSKEIAGRQFSFTTGQIGRQASGCIITQYGETAVLTAAQTGPGRPGIDFFPLTVDYRERFAAAGKFAGGFLKREGRPTTKEILTCRLTDRPIRPLFPKGFRDEVQIQGNVMACDGENDPDVVFLTSASAALSISGMPFNGPIAGVRVGMVEGELVLMPTVQQMEESSLDLIVAGSKDSVLMIEGFADQLPEKEMGDAIMFAHKAIVELCALQEELAAKVGNEKTPWEAPAENPFYEQVKAEFYDKMMDAKVDPLKANRREKGAAVKEAAFAKFFPDDEVDETSEGHTRKQLGEALYKLTARVIRDSILDGKRIDGRAPGDLREVNCDVGLLPKVHGSALFTRGETQSLATLRWVLFVTSSELIRCLVSSQTASCCTTTSHHGQSVNAVRFVVLVVVKSVTVAWPNVRSLHCCRPRTSSRTRFASSLTSPNRTVVVRWPVSAVPLWL